MNSRLNVLPGVSPLQKVCQQMDYDHPFRERRNWRRPYGAAVIVLAWIGFVWAAGTVISFLAMRGTAQSFPGVVVGYEVAGGRERLRVQVLPNGKPKGFMLVETADAWPRYAVGQKVELLSRLVTNSFGQKVQETTAYAPRNYWQKLVVVCAVSFMAAALGVVGLIRSRRATSGKT
jgi:hypothetical protein